MNDSIPQTLRLGGCQCGAIRYELAGDPLKLVICHCRECRKQSASAFGISVFVARERLRLTRGSPKFWIRPTDSGHALECAFCPHCGSRLWHQRVGAAETISVKGGSLDDAIDLRAAVHIWTSRMLPGIILPIDATQFSGQP
ncbi:GFA family protein [Accumulibacter sp.]|jgi:Uncharacterized conserved protein|uniref:Glutathione-dependent formaldehyde-activating GFA n=1 Tax=Accumulibacter regalis TaxID=522306 RepID=C7RUR3_ACCRE|nr:GFA family protein [Accumulibacter sp.]MBN8498197.1 GFA family protein [Accumulibacter sp.]MBO3716274.1 GFA family protein [Accumulibacter sp.]